MTNLLDAIREGEDGAGKDSRFPHAPPDWKHESAARVAQQEGLKPGEDHWEVLRALQEYYARHRETAVNIRELNDALEEKFHAKAAASTYQLFPAGRWRRVAESPASTLPGAVDRGFGRRLGKRRNPIAKDGKISSAAHRPLFSFFPRIAP